MIVQRLLYAIVLLFLAIRIDRFSFITSDDDDGSVITIEWQKPPSHTHVHGAGVQISAYPWFDLTDDQWTTVFDRFEHLGIRFTRVMLSAFMYVRRYDARTKLASFDFQSPYMVKLYRVLDWCERHNVVVMVGEWGRPLGGDQFDGIALDDPAWPALIGTFLDHMLLVKKYTCIQWYNIINEPHGAWSHVPSYEHWRRALLNLHRELVRRQLHTRVRLVAPDGSREWTRRVLTDADVMGAIGMIDEHWYASRADVQDGVVERVTLEQRRLVPSTHTYVLGEAAIQDGKTPDDRQPNVVRFWYAVAMADMCVQLIRAGVQGVVFWIADDAMHYYGDGDVTAPHTMAALVPPDAYARRKAWGMFDILSPVSSLPRPWYYSVYLLARFFPPSPTTKVLQVVPTASRLRVLAVTVGGKDFSIIVVNHEQRQRHVLLPMPFARNVVVHVYEMFDVNGDDRVDAWDGVTLAPKPTYSLQLSVERQLWLPGQGVVLITTLS